MKNKKALMARTLALLIIGLFVLAFLLYLAMRSEHGIMEVIDKIKIALGID